MRTCTQFGFSIRIRFNTPRKCARMANVLALPIKKNESWKIACKSGSTEKTFTISSAVLSNRLEAIRLMFKHWMNNQYWIKDFRSLLMSLERQLATLHKAMWNNEKCKRANATDTQHGYKISMVCLSVGFNYCTIMLYLSMNIVRHCWDRAISIASG